MLIFIMTFSLLAFLGCSEKASKYTEAEHIQRVTERVQKRFMTEQFDYTGFEVYPLYDENDVLTHFLVEFEPYGYYYVLLRDEQKNLTASTSMYKLFERHHIQWSPYKIDETNSQPAPDIDKIWELDEKGEEIVYKKSPYSIANLKGVKFYFLNIDNYYVPAIKINGIFQNLISHEEAKIVDGHFTKKQAYLIIFHTPPKKIFDL